MKKIINLLLLVIVSYGALQAQNVHVQGTFLQSNGSNKKELTLSKVNGNKVEPVENLTISDKGQFQFNLSLTEPTMYLLTIPGNRQQAIHLMLHPKDRVKLTMQTDDSTGFLELTSAEGSKDMKLYQSFNQQLCQFTRTAESLDKEYRNSEGNPVRQQELSEQFMQLQALQKKTIRDLLVENADLLMSAFLVTYFDDDIDTYYEVYETIDQKLSKTRGDNQFVKYVDSKVKSHLGAGRMAPEIAMKDPDGNIRKLSDLRGKVVMIDFWASWCRPCRMENPNVVKLYHRYHDKGFEIFSVSLDKNRNDWTNAIKNDGLVWENHVSDLNGWTSTGGAAYGITSVPSTVLVDREGRIIAKNLRGKELEFKLKEIFGE